MRRILRWRVQLPIQVQWGDPRCRDCSLASHYGAHLPVRECLGPFISETSDERIGFCPEPQEHHPYRPIGLLQRRDQGSFWWGS